MDPNIIFDCEKVLPNRFGLALAAAARIRALNRGSEPRIRVADAGTTAERALREIAAGVFRLDELAPFMSGPEEVKRLASSDPIPRSPFVTTALRALPPRPSPVRGRGSTDDATN